MPKGLKQSSSPIQVSSSQSITVDPIANQFISKRVDLQLNPLDNEVFVVTGLKIDFNNPNARPDPAIAGDVVLLQRCSISTTEQTTYAGIESPSVVGASQVDVLENGTLGYMVIHENNAMDAPPASMDYLQIIATNDFFVNYFVSSLYAAGQDVDVSIRVYGYRATADASTYAALVQSELLSS